MSTIFPSTEPAARSSKAFRAFKSGNVWVDERIDFLLPEQRKHLGKILAQLLRVFPIQHCDAIKLARLPRNAAHPPDKGRGLISCILNACCFQAFPESQQRLGCSL